jgi:transposase InsO family protein
VCLAAARAVVDEGLHAREVGRRFGVPYTTVLDWSQKYRARGAEGLATAGRWRVPKSGAASAPRAAIVAAKQARPEAGSRTIRDLLRRYFGVGTSATTVRRVLQQEGLSPAKPRARTKPQARAQRFERAEPNQLWQSDLFTFLLRKHERLYVAAFLDDHSRYLVSLALAHHQKSSLVLEALARGIADYGAPREILTDQGRQYTSWRGSTEFEAELKRHGIRHVKSRPHHPQTCGKIERFWKTLWEELISRTVFADFADCERRVRLFIQHYNFQRPHQALDGQTPADRFFRAASPVRAAVEATVAANALRLARAQPPKLPFYLVGRLGDRDLTIHAEGGELKLRVGDEETTITMGEEDGDEQGNGSGGWQEGAGSAAGIASPSGAALAEERYAAGCDRAEPAADAACGALGGDAGDDCDRAGEDLARDLLQARDARPERDARGAEPARGVGAGRELGSVPGDRADREPGNEAEVPGTGQAPGRAAAVADPQDAARAADDGPARAVAGPTARRGDATVPWRALARHLERTLIARALAPAGEGDGQGQVELHADPGGAAGGGAASHGDPERAVGPADRLAGGARAGALAQSLPEPAAPRDRGAGVGALRTLGGPAGEGAGTTALGSRACAPHAGEREAQEPGGRYRAPAGGGEWADPGPDPGERAAGAPAQVGAEGDDWSGR